MSTTAESYSESFPRLQRAASLHARRILRDPGEADDVVQDALLRAYVAWDEIAGFDEAWVGRVAINLAIDRLRRMSLSVPATGRGGEAGVPVDLRIDVSRAIALLARRQRQVVVLRYVADLSVQAVAELLDISAGSVKRHLHRAITALREPSAGLSGAYTNETPEEKLMSNEIPHWRTRFRLAVEPAEGWPPGPWDHRWFEAEGDEVQRLACDHRTGEPIIDADGDEVRTGPGTDFILVKVDRSLTRAFTPWDEELAEAPLDRLDASAHEVLAHAQRLAIAFSDGNGIGAEHLAMALMDLVPGAEETFGMDSSSFRRAVATFRDGPHADARLALVEQRLTEGWSAAPAAGELPLRIEGLSELLSEAVRRADYFGSHLPEEEPRVMVRAVDLLHLLADPGERYSFIRALIEGDHS